MRSTALVPEVHHDHPRHAGALDWVTVAVWLIITTAFVVSLLAPVRGHAEAALEAGAPAVRAAPHALAATPCPPGSARCT
jgi:hypothetical protein